MSNPNDLMSRIQNDYNSKRSAIDARLRDFERVREKGNIAAFEELCYCLFTAGTSARTGMRSVDAIRDLMLEADQNEISNHLLGIHRYSRKRAEYVVLARQFVQEEMGFKIFETLDPMPQLERRSYIVKNIKGLGYKEGSHFLRNIGYKGYAILDRHILRNLGRLGVTNIKASPSSPKVYLELEKTMKFLADKMGVDFDALDLVLWSMETGEILK
jgi:N-glycosylase/DNA lyase